jgi:type I restriction enzyme, S subunit
VKVYNTLVESTFDWIGCLPSHWKILPLKYISTMNGRIGWKGLKQEEFTTEGPFLVTGQDIKDDKIDWDKCYHITLERYEESPEIMLEENDLLFTKDGTIGKTLFIEKLPGPTSLNSHLLLIRPKGEDYFSKFLQYQFKSPPFLKYVEFKKTGTTFYGVSQETMMNYWGLFPSIEEQFSIVSFLDNQTQNIDQLIDLTEKKIKLLKEQRTSLINHCVTKGLNPNVEMKDSGVEWIGKIPSHWDRSKIKYLSNKISKGTTPSTIGKSILEDGPIFYIKMSDFIKNEISIPNNFIDEETHRLLERSSLKEGDILFVITGEIGKTVIVKNTLIPSNTNQNISFIRLKNLDKVKFTWYWLFSDSIQNHLKTLYNVSTLPSLSMEDLGNFDIPQPEIEVQKQIVEYLDEHTQKIDTTIEIESQRIDLLKEYRQSLISEVVTGKIDVRDWKE